MPKDRIERSLRRGSAVVCHSPCEEIRYEGYGPGNVAVIVETLTDNRNRTASAIRAAFSKNGGTLGETNSFERIGTFQYPTSVASADAILDIAIDVGASDVRSVDRGHKISCAPEKLSIVREALERRLGVPASFARIEWRPVITVSLSDESTIVKLLKFIEYLKFNEDVYYIAANCNIPKPLLERFCLSCFSGDANVWEERA